MFTDTKISKRHWRNGGLSIAILALGLVSGCGEPKITKSPLASQSDGGETGGGTTGGTTGGALSLTGTWMSQCEEADEEGSSWSKTTAVFSGSSVVNTVKYYSDANCTTETSILAYTASIVIGSAMSSPSGAYALQSTISTIMATYKTDEGVQSANEGVPEFGITPQCGGGFTKDVARELNASNCAEDTFFSSAFTPSYNIIKADGDKLYYGELTEENDGSAIDKRPTTLMTSYLSKQP